jgi:hypothetical protein
MCIAIGLDGVYIKGHTRMFDILDEGRCLVGELEDVELKCTRLMSLGEHCGWLQHTG